MSDKIREIFETFRENRKKNEITFNQLQKQLDQYANKIVLYGAGSAGIALATYLRRAGIYPKYFSDGDSKKWGSYLESLEIIAPEEIVTKLGEDALVILTINTDGKNYADCFADALKQGGQSKVFDMLHTYHCKNIIEYKYLKNCYQLFTKEEFNLPSCIDVNLTVKHEDEIIEVYKRLEDDMSREVFMKNLEYRLIDGNTVIPSLEPGTEYFEDSLFNVSENEAIVDCGAFNGNTLKRYIQKYKEFDMYYAIEPDSTNFKNLTSYVNSLEQLREKIHLENCCVGDINESVSFYQLNGPGSFCSHRGKTRVNQKSIDSILNGNYASLIKMNIEGREKEALVGARNTIARFTPVLTIMAYHRTEDLWEIPKIVTSINEDYKIYLRSYMNQVETCYIFVPRRELWNV